LKLIVGRQGVLHKVLEQAQWKMIRIIHAGNKKEKHKTKSNFLPL
jgi:hypothetical protein